MLSNYITRPCIRRQSAEAVGRYGIAKRPAYCSCLLLPVLWWLWVDSNHQPRAYETLALPLSYTADHQEAGAVGRSRRFAKRTPLPTAAVFCLVSFWGPAEELNLVPFHPALKVRFRRPMPGTQAFESGGRSRCRRQQRSYREASCLPAPAFCLLSFWCPRKDLNLQPLVCRTSAPSVELLGRLVSSTRQEAVSRYAHITKRLPTAPAFCLLFFWSELELSQPLGFFRPALIRLSYPTLCQ